jgi:hypothetical protein
LFLAPRAIANPFFFPRSTRSFLSLLRFLIVTLVLMREHHQQIPMQNWFYKFQDSYCHLMKGIPSYVQDFYWESSTSFLWFKINVRVQLLMIRLGEYYYFSIRCWQAFLWGFSLGKSHPLSLWGSNMRTFDFINFYIISYSKKPNSSAYILFLILLRVSSNLWSALISFIIFMLRIWSVFRIWLYFIFCLI